ncbi:MAG: hypothetical protein O6928_08230, partial [Gammaproteobacteria bacterium]|nr:hypothetical protein [Gammaproteobacteria bacterium]
NPASNCTFNPGTSTYTTIGRLPFRILGLADIRDSNGERLWYAVSDNFRNTQSNDAVINSDTPGRLTVDGMGDVVAVIIAPGIPVTGQDSRPSDNDSSEYLEGDNATDDDQSFVSTAGGEFNDRLITITRSELMRQVEIRVLAEVRAVLSQYNNVYGAYPWLSPFADPKADSRILSGTHTGSNNVTILTDSSTDFNKWGVKNFDIVRNVTDGSLSIVTGITATTLTVTNIDLGNASNDNDFDTEDEYYIVSMDTAEKIDDSANITSSGLTLVDDDQEFVILGVVPGDIIDNITDGSSGIVESVSSESTIIVKGLSGGTDNDFDNNDNYQLRSYTGESTNVIDDTLILEDDTKDFLAMGVSAGDLIVNIEDGSSGRVASVTPTTITASGLNFGMQNDFDDNEIYILPQHYGIAGTREGLLSFHRVGGYFPSGFNVDWNIPELIAATANATVSVNTPGTHTDYINTLKQFVQTSNGTSGTITVAVDEGTCVWTLPEIVECKGSHTRYDPVQGQVTSGSDTAIVTDNTKDFVTAGINPGDIVQNYDDETLVFSSTATAGSNGTTLEDSSANFSLIDPIGLYNFLVRNTSYAGPNKAQGILAGIDSGTTLNVNDYSGWGVDPVTFSSDDNYSIYTPAKTVVSAVTSATTLTTNRLSASAPDFDTLEFYRIKSASGKLTGTTTSSAGSTLNHFGRDFSAEGIQIDDVVHNVTDGSWGEISAVGTTTLAATLYDSSGNTTNFDNNEDYEVYYAYMNSRRYEFIVRFSGTAITGAVNGSRKRDVCLGYTNCTGSATNVSLPFYNLSASGTTTSGSSVLLLEDSASDFEQRRITPGHVVFNATDGSNGIITTLDTNKQVTVGELNDGTENDFDSVESYYITAPVVSIKDYDASENELGSAAVTIPSSGAQGSIKVSNIDYYLNEANNDLPPWFLKNKWYQFIYVAYSSGDEPDAVDPPCTAPGMSSCLQLNGAVAPVNNKRAVVVAAGPEINTTMDDNCNTVTEFSQNRVNGSMNEYFESENCDPADDTFTRGERTTTFNDQVSVVAPVP